MTKLIIKGPSNFDSRWFRNSVFLDGEKIGRIGYNETLECDVEFGNHNLITKYLWLESKSFSFLIENNVKKTFEISRYKSLKYIFPIFLIILLLFVIARISFNINLNFLIYIGIIVLVYPWYFLTLGKNKYFRINELQ